MLVQRDFYKKLPMPEEQEFALMKNPMEKSKGMNLQDVFLNSCRKNGDVVIIQLTDGSERRGSIIGFDNNILIIGNEQQQLMIYKSGIVAIHTESGVRYITNRPKYPEYNN